MALGPATEKWGGRSAGTVLVPGVVFKMCRLLGRTAGRLTKQRFIGLRSGPDDRTINILGIFDHAERTPTRLNVPILKQLLWQGLRPIAAVFLPQCTLSLRARKVNHR
jgi:hypothetical protein